MSPNDVWGLTFAEYHSIIAAAEDANKDPNAPVKTDEPFFNEEEAAQLKLLMDR